MDTRKIDKQLQSEFAQKKIAAENLAAKNLAKANSNSAFFKLASLEKELILEISKCKANKKPHSEYDQILKTLREQKNIILKKLKLTEADLKPKYECEKCLDTGFVGDRMCSCYSKRRNAEMIKACGLSADAANSFENFDENYASDPEQSKEQVKLKEFLMSWADKYPKVKKHNILISGSIGVGKTFLSQCLANYMAKKGYSVCYMSSFEMNNAFLNYHTSFEGTKRSWLEPLIESDFLFIDDLGTEPRLNNVTVNYLFLVLSERERFSRPVIITTNLLPNNILDSYGERIYSRLTSKLNSVTLHLGGSDLRLNKK